MTKLNLPEYTFRTRKGEKGDQIFDAIRKKFVALTPEEWVRQNFIRYLIEEKKYPASLIAVETGLRYHTLKKRCDIAVHDRKGHIWMIVECKKPEVKITQDVFDQAAVYNMAQKTKTKFITVTNGMRHYCCELDPGIRGDYEQLRHTFRKDLPAFS